MKQLEHDIQTAFFDWLDRYAALRWNRYTVANRFQAFSIPNDGQRSICAALWHRAQGLRAGVPDVFIPIPSINYHGLWIEFKRDSGSRVSIAQMEWIRQLQDCCYCVRVCRSVDEAINVVTAYMEGREP
jgi:hypothetical protein